MNNVIKFPRNEGPKKEQPQPQQLASNAGRKSVSTLRNIIHGVIGALYIVLAILWMPVRFMLIVTVVLQFFRMLFKWHISPFDAAWPFVLSFVVLAVLTYIMATWKPEAP